MKREYMICLNCIYQEDGFCFLNPYRRHIGEDLGQDLQNHFCGQGEWKERFEHMNLFHTRKWGEWSDEDLEPHIQSYTESLIERAEAYRLRKFGRGD